ncbi:unnamed protein product, partial [Mycena citricolor]
NWSIRRALLINMSEPEVIDASSIDEDDIDAVSIFGEHLINVILAGESLDNIKKIVETGAPLWYQNELEGISCLHAAAYVQNTELVRYLIQEGAVWNAVDYLKNTAGDIALSFNNEDIYTIIRNAGIRAELLLARMSALGRVQSESALVLRSTDETAAASTDTFLSSKLRFTVDEHGQDICMVEADGDEIGVMMGWETEIMRKTVQRLSSERDSKSAQVLNVGFGLGIIDSFFQALSPSLHVIIEAHPDVLKRMKDLGWYDKPGVRVLEGKWQDFINDPEKLASIVPEGGFDLVYTDSFSEDYEALRQFFGHLPTLLGPQARFSFFNGLGATNLTFYDVYTRVSEIHLAEAGFDVKWADVDLHQQKDRWGNSRAYFTCPTYRLPVVSRRK